MGGYMTLEFYLLPGSVFSCFFLVALFAEGVRHTAVVVIIVYTTAL